MRKLFLYLLIAICAPLARSQSEPIVAVDNLTVTHEHKGWRVTSASTTPIHFNLAKGDLIVRIDGKNAAETGPMQMASLFNQQNRRKINLFIERGGLRLEIALREILPQDYAPVGANPFRSVAIGFNAPDTEFKDIDGRPLSLEQFKGKWLLIDFMATWCPPCIETLPQVLSAADHNQLSLLIVALNDKTESVRRVQRNYKISAPIAMMRIESQLPIDFGITTNRWTGQVPALVLIRPDGEVAMIDIGGLKADQIEKTIQCIISCKTADEAMK